MFKMVIFPLALVAGFFVAIQVNAAQNGGVDNDHEWRACFEALLVKEKPDYVPPQILLESRCSASAAIHHLCRAISPQPSNNKWQDWYRGTQSLVGHRIVVTELYENNTPAHEANHFYNVQTGKTLRMSEVRSKPGLGSAFPIEGLVLVHTNRRMVIQTSQGADSPGRFVVIAYPRAARTKTAFWEEKRVKQIELSTSSNFVSVFQDLSGSANLEEARLGLAELQTKNMQDYAIPSALLSEASAMKFFKEYRNDLGYGAFQASGFDFTNSVEEAVRHTSYEAMQRGIDRDRRAREQSAKSETGN